MSRARKLLRLGVLGGRASEEPPEPTALFLDTFTDADGTALAAHTPDVDASGNGWADLDGTAQITGGKAIMKDPPEIGAAALVAADVGLADGVVRVTLHTGSSTVFRCSDPGNHWEAYYLDGYVVAAKRTSEEGWEEVDSTAYTPADPNSVTLTVTLAGSSITVVADNDPASTIQVTDAAHQTATKHGLLFYDETAAADDFSITAA